MNRNYSHDNSTLTIRYKKGIKILLGINNYQNVIDYISSDLGVPTSPIPVDLGNQCMFSLAE
jgi:hypothetical protein